MHIDTCGGFSFCEAEGILILFGIMSSLKLCGRTRFSSFKSNKMVCDVLFPVSNLVAVVATQAALLFGIMNRLYGHHVLVLPPALCTCPKHEHDRCDNCCDPNLEKC